MDDLIVATAEKVFGDLASRASSGADDIRAQWATLADTGLPLAWVGEEHNGAGASVAEGFGAIAVSARFAVSLPFTDTMLAGWLLSQAGIASPDGPMSVAPSRPRDRIGLNADGTLVGRARGVAFARHVDHFAVLASGPQGASVALVRASDCRIERAHNVGYEPSDIVTLDHVTPVAVERVKSPDQTALMLMGAAIRSLQIAGALETALRMSVDYANQRVAFEKPIAKFQAIQHNLAQLAGEAAAAVSAAGSAADALAHSDKFDDAIFLEAASAKIRCAEAAEKGAAIAHQVHGAIGFSMEYPLHRFTLRMLGWRDDFGNETFWAAELGRRIAQNGADDLWPLVASR